MSSYYQLCTGCLFLGSHSKMSWIYPVSSLAARETEPYAWMTFQVYLTLGHVAVDSITAAAVGSAVSSLHAHYSVVELLLLIDSVITESRLLPVLAAVAAAS